MTAEQGIQTPKPAGKKETAPPIRARLIRWKRLALAIPVLTTFFVLLGYLESSTSGGGTPFTEARILDTPPAPGRQLKVGAQKGSLAPNFEISGFDDRRFRLSDFRGSPVVVKFWATWCASCLAEFPHLKLLQADHSTEGLRILAVNAGQSYEQAKEYADFLNAPAFDWALDRTLTVSDAYKVIGFPVSVFIDRDGVVQATYVGQMDEELMRQYVQAAIDAVPAPDAPFKLRLITNLGRENLLHVLPPRGRGGDIVLASQSFRCDSAFCADSYADPLAAMPGVRSVKFNRKTEPPQLSLRFDTKVTTREALTEAVKGLLETHPDPLYEGPPQVRYETENR